MLVTCDKCQSKIKVPDSAAGKRGKCPKCGAIIAIPAAEAPEPAEAPAAGGSPFDFGEEAPAEEAAPPRKGKSTPARDEEEVAEEPGGEKKKVESQGLSITSLVLGILSLVCSCCAGGAWYLAPIPLLCAIAAIITGFLGMKKGGKPLAIVGMSLGGFSILLTIILAVVAFLWLGAMLATLQMNK
jgi:hypothetical protein